MQTLARREWLKQTSLSALGLGFSLHSLANEEGMTRSTGSDKGLINLGANENPYGTSPKAKQAIFEMIASANRYQMNVPSLVSFKEELAAYYKVGPDQILITAGSGEALVLLARHFTKGNIVAPDITFGILPNTAKKIGTPVMEVPVTREKEHDVAAMLRALTKDTSAIYIVNPANPTGSMLKPSVLKSFCEEASKRTCVLIDEAYIDYLDTQDQESMIPLTAGNLNILVLLTFSKIHGMAGLRVGFVIAHSTLIRQLEQSVFGGTQFCLSNLSMTAALASLADKEHQRMSKQKNDIARKFTVEELRKLSYRCIEPFANFIFFHVKKDTGNFSSEMLGKNMIVRSNQYADGQWSRVSIGTLDEMRQFIQVMKQAS